MAKLTLKNIYLLFYLSLISIGTIVFLYINVTPYNGINGLRAFCYIPLGVLLIGFLYILNYSKFKINLLISIVASIIFVIIIIIQNHNLPLITFKDAQQLVKERYKAEVVDSTVNVVDSKKYTDLYLIEGKIGEQEVIFTVNPNSKEIKELEYPYK